MADISKELAAILAAVYGRDVRGSIHDAIEKINDVSEKQLAAGSDISSPSSSAVGYTDGSLYINTDVYELWRCVDPESATPWQSLGVFANAIVSVVLTSTSGLVDTYTITFTDGTTTTFNVTNGKDGLVWYRGTAITGTGSGITGAEGKQDDFYINTNTGYIYQCTKTGDVTTAEWMYVMALAGGPPSITVVDHLSSTDPNYALSANQGHVLDQKKVDKPASPTDGQIMKYNATSSKWEAADEERGGHEMYPDPTSASPGTKAQEEAAIVTAIKAKMTSVGEGWANENVGSLNSIGVWSNTMSKTFTISGSANNSPIGTTGIGTWYDGEPADIDPTTDEVDWISIPLLIGLSTNNEIDVKILFDPAKTSIPIVLGGYIIDDTTGKMCIKFANEIEDADTETAVVAVELIIKRTETTAVSFS